MLDDIQERHIAHGLREGKADAWLALYDAFAERVWRMVARLLGGANAEVADVVQETMLAAAKSARSFDPARGSLWSWLGGIAHRQAVLFFRKQGQRSRLTNAVAVLTVSDSQTRGEPEPIESLATGELADLVRATLVELPPEYALLLTAHYLDGEAVADIANRERATEVAIRSKLARARQTFREAFGKHEASRAP